MPRALPGVLLMSPRCPSLSTIRWTVGGVTAKWRGMSASAGAWRCSRPVLLGHKFQSLPGLFHPLAQHGRRGRVRADWTVMARLTVAIESVT